MEGKRTYRTGMIVGSSDEHDNALRAKRSGFPFNFANSIIVPSPVTHIYPDAFVLCTTVRRSPESMSGIGGFCVEIQQPTDFLSELLELINARYPRVDLAKFSLVTYRKQEFKDGEEEPGELPFTKDPDKYEKEKEARMLFTARSGPPLLIDPQAFVSKSLGRLCRRVR
jgi:hypothetical protein